MTKIYTMKTNNSNEKLIKISIVDNPIESALFKSTFENLDIPFIIKEYHDSAYDGIFESVKGWGEIYSTEKYKNQILEIIDTLRSTQS